MVSSPLAVVWNGIKVMTSEPAAPANAASLLRSASMLIRDATLTITYPVDANGAPTDPAMIRAFNDATCSQAAHWAGANIDPTSYGIPQAGILREKAIGSARLGYDTAGASSVTITQAKMAAATSLCAEAVMILQQAGLNLATVWTSG